MSTSTYYYLKSATYSMYIKKTGGIQKKIMIKFLILIVWSIGPKLVLCGAQNCAHRDYGNGGTVCVCNSTYCDTIARVEKVEAPQFVKYTSNKDGLRFEKELGRFGTRNGVASNAIYIDAEVEFQQILGWGGAFTDSFGINLNSLENITRDNLLQSYFSENGIEYSLCRVPIGGTDFSLRGYSYDDGEADPELINFELVSEDFDYKIPYILKASNLTGESLKLFASVWAAPKWIKTNNEYAGGFLKEDMYQTWANYFVKFLDMYRNENIQFWGITTGNEPGEFLIPGLQIPNVGWVPQDHANWILNNLGPTIRNSNHSNIKIIAFEDQRIFLPSIVDQILNDSTTRQYIDGIAFHWYANIIAPASLLSETHEHFPEKFLLSTEACTGYLPLDQKVLLGSWQRGEDYAADIIEDINNWTGGWIDWNMALDLTGGPTYINNFVDSPIIVNATAGEFYKNPMFYSLGHFSKFVPRDSTRIFSSATSDTSILNAAFKRPDNGTVVVILNKNDQTVQASIIDGVRGSAEIELSANSITTILYW